MGTLKVWNQKGHSEQTWDPALPETMVGVKTFVREAVDNGQLVFEKIEGEDPKRTEEFNPDADTIHILAPISGG